MNYPELARMQNADALPNNDNSIAESSALSYIMQINFNWFALCIPYAGNGGSTSSSSNCGSRSGFIFPFYYCCYSCCGTAVAVAIAVAVVAVVVAAAVVVVVVVRRRSSSCNSPVVNSFPPFFVYTIWATMLFAVS